MFKIRIENSKAKKYNVTGKLGENNIKKGMFSMKDNRKEFVFVIGKSEGMDKDAMLSGFNALVDAQKKIDDESTFSLVFFNDTYKASALGKSLKEMRKYNAMTYAPKNGSALYDAMGFAMDSVGEMLSETAEEERPSQVCMIIIGESDNASTVYDYATVDEMVKVQKYTYKWDFIFYGDGNASFDINKGGSLADTEKMFTEINNYMTSLR